MTRLDSSSSRLDQEGIEDEVIVPVDEENFTRGPQVSFKGPGAVSAAKSCTENDDTVCDGRRFEFHTPSSARGIPPFDNLALQYRLVFDVCAAVTDGAETTCINR